MWKLAVYSLVLCSAIDVAHFRTVHPGNLKIVGGDDADISTYPWQVALINDDNFFFCGGVLISQTWVLTDATCIKFYLNKKISVRAGSSSWQSDGQVVDVKRKVVHSDTNPDKPENNLALLELSSPVTTSTAKAAKLAAGFSDKIEEGLFSVIGWGRINASATFYPTKLQAIEISIANPDYCRKQYEDKYNVTSNMFCGSVAYGQSPCFGDAGGSVSSGDVVVGITNSWGIRCALTSAPAIFMKVSAYRNWIKSIAGV